MVFVSLIFSVYVGLIVHLAKGYQTEEFEIRMPNVRPGKADTYLHTTRDLGDDSDRFIVAFEPIASMDTVHHMMVHGCQYAAKLDTLGLGECYGKKSLFYVWGRNAPSLHLPKDVGFKVGENVGIRYISLEVHYSNVSAISDSGDTSGVKLYLTSAPLPKRAGVAILGTGGYIKGGTTEHFEVACPVTTKIEIHPFAFRTHAHERGLLISGYRVRAEINGTQNWSLIGKKNPLLPQCFYPMDNNNMIIKQGDILTARCTMKNEEKRTIRIGATSKDEMCNFYIMFYVEDQHLGFTGCFSSGPPYYYWTFDSSLNNIPSDASTP